MRPAQFRDSDPKSWHGPIDVNLFGVLNCSRNVIGDMCDRGWGRVITIASGAGMVGLRIGVSAYGAGKGGAIGFMRHLAIESARFGVTANTLALGLMTNPGGPGVAEALARQIPVGRTGTPEDIGCLVRLSGLARGQLDDRPDHSHQRRRRHQLSRRSDGRDGGNSHGPLQGPQRDRDRRQPGDRRVDRRANGGRGRQRGDHRPHGGSPRPSPGEPQRDPRAMPGPRGAGRDDRGRPGRRGQPGDHHPDGPRASSTAASTCS